MLVIYSVGNKSVCFQLSKLGELVAGKVISWGEMSVTSQLATSHLVCVMLPAFDNIMNNTLD